MSGPAFKWYLPFCFYHSKPGQIMSGFGMVASLDRFIKKRVIKNILFMTKRSRLVYRLICRSRPFDIWTVWNPDSKSVERWPFESRTIHFSDVYCITANKNNVPVFYGGLFNSQQLLFPGILKYGWTHGYPGLEAQSRDGFQEKFWVLFEYNRKSISTN
jgi:hypothetical protein